MTPGTYPLYLYRGDSYSWRFVVWADTAQTDPADLTGVTARAQARQTVDGPVLFELVCTITDNEITAVLPAAAWAGVTGKKGVWDLQLTYPSGEVATILAGPVAITIDVTLPVVVQV